MSQEKAQLIAPIGITTFTGLTATGVITATSFAGNIVGSAKSLVTGTNVTAGVMTATSFAGNLTGNIQRLADSAPNINVGVTTATSFVGNLTGSVTDLTSAPNITVGVVTATRFEGPVTGDVEGNVTGNVTGVATGTQSGGNIVGNVVGNITGDVDGDVTGNVTGNIQGDVTGDITGNIQGAVTGNITGNVQGAVTGNITGDIQGDVTGDVTGNLQGNVTGNVVGVATGSVTGDVTGNLQGNVTGNVTGDIDGDVTGNITGNVQGNVTGNVTGNATGVAAGGLGINYNGGWTGAGTSQVRVGVVTATTLYGDGSNLDGISSGSVSQQSVTANSATTTIDLSSGNVIYMTQSANTTISFSNPENGNVYLIRTKDDNSTARTITWPASINWDGGSAPTLIQDNPRDSDIQVFLFVTRSMGVKWYGKEVVNIDPQTFTSFIWGRGTNGSLGLNNAQVSYSSPIQLGETGAWGKLPVISMDMDAATVALTKIDGTLWTWGQNGSGQLGLNQPAPTQISSPTQVPGTTWNQVAPLQDRGCMAVKTDGTLWVWGDNKYGQLGLIDGHSADFSSPVQLPGTTWGITDNSIGAGYYRGGNIKTDGTMWMWGYNGEGELGVNDKAHRSSPTQVPGTWRQFSRSLGQGTNLAIKTDGTLWSWGSAFAGNLGIGSPDNGKRSSPCAVGTNTNWTKASAGYKHCAAIKDDGTLWMFGSNEFGQLGFNESGFPNSYSSPKQLPGTWNTISCAREWNIATKTDGTMWVWGQNDEQGFFGRNVTAEGDISSPVQIPGTDWNDAVAWYYAAMANKKG